MLIAILLFDNQVSWLIFCAYTILWEKFLSLIFLSDFIAFSYAWLLLFQVKSLVFCHIAYVAPSPTSCSYILLVKCSYILSCQHKKPSKHFLKLLQRNKLLFMSSFCPLLVVVRPSEVYYQKLSPLLKEAGASVSNRKTWPKEALKTVMTELIKETPANLLSRYETAVYIYIYI